MNKHRRNIIYTAIQVAWRLILGNIFFLISNILLVLLSWNIKFTLLTSIAYIICSITIFPSLIALISYMRNEKVEDKIGLGFKVYLKSFKDAFKTGWLTGLIYEFVITFLILDLISANKLMKNGQLFTPLLTLLIILVVINIMWNMLVQSYFYVSLKNSFIYSTKLLMSKPLLSLEMIIIIFGSYLSFKFFPQYAILFIVPLTAYILWRITEKEFDNLKKEVVIKN